jgi:hypothetical protein
MKKTFLVSGILIWGLIMAAACTTTLFTKKAEAAEDYQKIFEAAYSQLQIGTPALREDKQPLVPAHYMP